MFSNIVTAAKGFFARADSDEASSANPPEGATSGNPKMVTATRQREIRPREETTESDNNSAPITNGKRKARATNSVKADGQHNKRRKRSSLEAAETIEHGSSGIGKGSESMKDEQTAASTKNNHVRFGSEEPEVPDSVHTDKMPEHQQVSRQNGDESSDDDDDDDDDAPEAIDNSTQMSKIKAEAQKLQKAKQREEQLKKEKRRQLDENRKLQAKLATKKLETGPVSNPPGFGTPGDDLVSESTVTLQGSTTQDSRRPALPALLPDEILNAAPAASPPTPAEEAGSGATKPSKLRFLDKMEKPPKDVNMGDVTIRVLDEPPSQKRAKPSLPPKASKVGRNSRENWLKSNSSTARVNGLRRTAGGTATSNFARK